MADNDKDGIPDNIDIDGGTGTNKPLPGASGAPTMSPDIAAIIAGIMGGGAGTGPSSSSTSSKTTSSSKLTLASARGLLNSLKDGVGYTRGFSTAEITEFMNLYNAEQQKQLASVATSVYNKRTPGAKTGDLAKIVETTMREEFPSFFDPTKFATDYLYSKINFGDTKGLAGKNIAIISSVRNLVSDFQILGYSDADALIASKDIAKGKYTLDDLTAKLQQLAIKEYPQFADRFAQDPKMTTRMIAMPVIKMLADTWEVAEDTIKLNSPIISQWLRPGGSDGKQPQMSYYDAYQKALNDPKRELTKQANEDARGAATELASSLDLVFNC